ncbi:MULTISPECIES: hypothetical protein [unclassified Mesorhizobium]|nr:MULTISPECIES: hypothetical protein [unclassified Mesorhizobium]
MSENLDDLVGIAAGSLAAGVVGDYGPLALTGIYENGRWPQGGER